MKYLKLILLFAFVTINAQDNYPLKFEGQIKGVFKVLDIDESKSANLIKLELQYLIKETKNYKIDIPAKYVALVYSNKLKARKSKHYNSLEKISVGKEYFFDLKHLLYYRSINPPPHITPKGFDLDNELIWKESEDFGLYHTPYLEGLFYVVDKYIKDKYYKN